MTGAVAPDDSVDIGFADALFALMHERRIMRSCRAFRILMFVPLIAPRHHKRIYLPDYIYTCSCSGEVFSRNIDGRNSRVVTPNPKTCIDLWSTINPGGREDRVSKSRYPSRSPSRCPSIISYRLIIVTRTNDVSKLAIKVLSLRPMPQLVGATTIV